MALVRIDFSENRSSEFSSEVSTIINSCMQEILGVPPEENYIVSNSYPSSAILHAPTSCTPKRLLEIVFIQITLNQGRSAELKAKFFSKLNLSLVSTGHLEAKNIFINIVEVSKENWSFGR